MANLVVTDNEASGKLVVDAVEDARKREALRANSVAMLNDAGVRKEVDGVLRPLDDDDDVVILQDTETVTHLVIPHRFDDEGFWATRKHGCANLSSLEDFVGHYVLQRCK
jgi:hypothetical protein